MGASLLRVGRLLSPPSCTEEAPTECIALEVPRPKEDAGLRSLSRCWPAQKTSKPSSARMPRDPPAFPFAHAFSRTSRERGPFSRPARAFGEETPNAEAPFRV